jgi:hypothetical protein
MCKYTHFPKITSFFYFFNSGKRGLTNLPMTASVGLYAFAPRGKWSLRSQESRNKSKELSGHAETVQPDSNGVAIAVGLNIFCGSAISSD